MAALEENAPCWSATMAGEVHLVPFRTQKLSPLAPMVLRSQSVGEQDVADQQGAFFGPGGPPSRERRGPSAVSGDNLGRSSGYRSPNITMLQLRYGS